MSTASETVFGGQLRQYRELAGLTQEELAAQAGITAKAIGALERGERRHPRPHTVRALAMALRLSDEQRALLVRLARAGERERMSRPPTDVAALVQTLSRERAAAPRPAALPVPANTLIGRDEELAATARTLANPACRLLTLIGPGGVGKTRLAIEVAANVANDQQMFEWGLGVPDGVAWISLASAAEAAHVPIAIADALGTPLRGAGPADDQLIELLRQRRMLLVLDNMEHLLAASDLLAAIVAQAPGVRLLVTSRERLRIGGEWTIELGGLALPHGPQSASASTAAVHLFTQRARQVAHNFVATGDNQAAVARICTLVDGMPLGIELAAAWIGMFSPTEIAEEIARNLDFLQRAGRGAPERHHSLRAVFDHSWKLLSVDERRAFARLSVFRGGFTREAAAEVAGATLEVLAALADKSLVRRATDDAGKTRYDLHELLRQYAYAQLETEWDETRSAHQQHCVYFARELATRGAAVLRGTVDAGLVDLTAEVDNVRAVWSWAVEQRDHRTLTQMGQSVFLLYEARGLFGERAALFRASVEALRAASSAASSGEVPPQAELVLTLGEMLSLYGISSARAGRYPEARTILGEAYDLLRERREMLARSGLLVWLAHTAYVLGAYDETRDWAAQGIDLSREHGLTVFQAMSLSYVALVAHERGQDEAVALAEQARDMWRVAGQGARQTTRRSWALTHILLARGEMDAAAELAREVLLQSGAIQDRWAIGISLLHLGMAALARHDIGTADKLVAESVATLVEIGDVWILGRALVTRGWIAEAWGDHDAARSAFRRAFEHARSARLPPIMLEARYGLAYLLRESAPADALAMLAEIIDEPATERTTRARALALGNELTAPSATPAGPMELGGVRVPETSEILTPREVEVLRLLATGRSNQVMAQDLVVAIGTVKRHVSNILGKLHAQSRLEAVMRARELNII